MSSGRVRAEDLDVERVGTGPTVLLVHGSIVDASRTWRQHRELAQHWTLCIPNRPGFAAIRPLARGDFELEAPLIAELLGDGEHLSTARSSLRVNDRRGRQTSRSMAPRRPRFRSS